MLINALFGKVYSLKTNIEVVVDRIVNTHIQLASVEGMNGEAERAATTRVGTATEVRCTEAFAPRVSNSRGQVILLVVQRKVVRVLRKIEQATRNADIAKYLESTTRSGVYNRTTAEVLVRVVEEHTEARRPA